MLCDATSCHRPVPCLATTTDACSRCTFLFSKTFTRPTPFIQRLRTHFLCLPGSHFDCPSCTHDTRRRTHNTTSPSFVKPTRLQPPSRCLPTTLMSTSSTRTALHLSMARSVSRNGGHRPQRHPAPPRRCHGHTSLSSLLMCVLLSPCAFILSFRDAF